MGTTEFWSSNEMMMGILVLTIIILTLVCLALVIRNDELRRDNENLLRLLEQSKGKIYLRRV